MAGYTVESSTASVLDLGVNDVIREGECEVTVALESPAR
jgi:hypothetical protein